MAVSPILEGGVSPTWRMKRGITDLLSPEGLVICEMRVVANNFAGVYLRLYSQAWH
jgi:hypothetical protein